MASTIELDSTVIEQLKLTRYDEGQKLKDTDRKYESALGDLVDNNFNEQATLNILESFRESQDPEEKEIAYSAFFVLIIHYRHQLDYEGLNDLWKNNNDYFKNFKSFNHLKILHFLYNINSSDIHDEIKHLKIAKENVKLYPENAGFNHALADLFATICEKYENEPDKLNSFSGWFNISLHAAKNAIKGEPKAAVFYCTKGRILSIHADYDKAETEFNIAIAKERSKRTDYSLRIGKYQYYKLLNQSRKQFKDVQVKLEEANNEIKQARMSNIEIIGLFSGVVSFVIGSITIATSVSAIETGFLIIILMGCLTGALSAFSLLLRLGSIKKGFTTYIPYIVAIICSLMLVAGTITAMIKFSPDLMNNNNTENTSTEDYNASSDI